MAFLNEDHVEQAGIETLKDLGWTYLHGHDIAPDGPAPQRPSYGDAVLISRLERWVQQINPAVPADAVAAALRKLLANESANLIEDQLRVPNREPRRGAA